MKKNRGKEKNFEEVEYFFFVKNGSREGALSRGSITGLGVIRGLTLLDLYPAPRGFLRFFPLPIFIVNICSFGFYLFFRCSRLSLTKTSIFHCRYVDFATSCYRFQAPQI